MPDIKTSSEYGDITSYLHAPKTVKSAVIIIHEVWGLNPHTRDVADRIAALGYAAAAPDLLTHTGILDEMTPDLIKRATDPDTRDEAQKELRAAMAPLQSPEFARETTERLKALYEDLVGQGYSKVAVMGFCFGGTYSWNLACAEPNLAAAIVFYGHAPHRDQLSKIACPVYGFYGETDQGLTGHLPELEETMKELGKPFDYVVYPGTGHAFFNDTNPTTYQKEAADKSWDKVKMILKVRLS